jgi:hypothetical protein
MNDEAGSDLAAVFGGLGRVRILGTLASASVPFTGYRIGKVARVQPIKVSVELRRLKAAGLVEELAGERGGSRWRLTDPDLRTFFRRRVRLSSWEDLRAGERERRRRARRVVASTGSVDFSKYRANPTAVSNPEQYVRRPEKDEELARSGLKTRGDARKR